MTRHFTTRFIALFFAIVAVILLADYFYHQLENTHRKEQEIGLAWQILNQQLSQLAEAETDQIDSAQLVDLSALAWPQSQKQALKQTGYLLVDLSQDTTLFHGYLPQYDKVLISEITTLSPQKPQWVWWCILSATLAAVIFSWLHPIIKDIGKVQAAAIAFGKKQHLPVIKIRPKSLVSPIADALATMTKRIHRLMSLQRDIATYAWHDIRTPLSRIRFACELIDSPEQQELKQYIVEEVQEIEGLLKELLLYAESEYSKPTMQFTQTNLFDVCQPVIDKFTQISALNIHNQICKDTYVLLDQGLFRRVIENLVGNTLRYASQNVWVRCCLEQDKVTIMVEDDGPGIATEKLDYITQPFVRESNSEDHNSGEGNSGLGLAIVESICTWHGGTFSVGNSTTRSGACFTIELPVAP